jgi:hypothetical protein
MCMLCVPATRGAAGGWTQLLWQRQWQMYADSSSNKVSRTNRISSPLAGSYFSLMFLSCFPHVLVALFCASFSSFLFLSSITTKCDVTCNYLHGSRYGSNGDAVEAPDGPSPASISMSRRPSFRAIVPPTLYDADSSDQPGKWRHLCFGLEISQEVFWCRVASKIYTTIQAELGACVSAYKHVLS